MIDDPHVDLGHLMIAIAEPDRDALEVYHRWFEREHMYQAVLIGPGAFAAERYVATRGLIALRFPRDAAPEDRVFREVDLGAFVALYYLARGTDDEHFAWSYGQTARLAAADRTNADRELVLTWLCDFRGRVARGGESVPEEIALDHRYEGLAMIWVEAASADAAGVDRLAEWLEREALPKTITGSPIDQVLLFDPRDFPPPPADVPITPGSIAPNPWTGRGLLLLAFLDASPAAVWSDRFVALGREVEASGLGTVRLAAPFLPVDRGTRRYLDELG